MLQFKRRQVKVHHVAWPAAILMVSAIVILSVWTAQGSHGWERVVINDVMLVRVDGSVEEFEA